MLRRGIGILLKNPSGNLFVQLIRYFVSGGVAFVVDASVFIDRVAWLPLFVVYSYKLLCRFGYHLPVQHFMGV